MKEDNPRQGQDCRVNPLLWEVICSTLLRNPAEQCVVRHVIGETLIQESLLLHREALALLHILSVAAGTRNSCCDCSVPVKHGECAQPLRHEHSMSKDGDQTLSEKPLPVRANTPTRRSCSHTKGDVRQRGIHSSSEDAQKLRSHLKTPDAKDRNCDANVNRLNKARKEDENIRGIRRSKDVKKDDVNGDTMRKAMKIKKEDVLQPQQQQSISSSSSSSSSSSLSDKTGKPTEKSILRQAPNRSVDDLRNAAQPLDFSALLCNCGDKINAYDIDEVVHEVHEAFAAEQVYLNHLVEQLRQKLDECVDSRSMVKNKPTINSPKEVKDRVNPHEVETSKNEFPIGIKTPHFGTKVQVGQKLPPASKAACWSKPSLLPTSKSIQREKPNFEPRSVSLSKLPGKSDKPSSKHVLAARNTNKIPTSPVK